MESGINKPAHPRIPLRGIQATCYALPVATQYIVVVCPESADITLYSATGHATQSCTGEGLTPGKVYFGQSSNGAHIPAGAYLEATAPVYVYHETSAKNDEHHLHGTTETP